MEHCVINGERCSKCCEVLTVRQTSNMRAWVKYVRRYGCDDVFNSHNKVFGLLKPISKRRAKKINPLLVSRIDNRQSYFTCRNFNGSGCSDYDNRPEMCSGYPYYGLTKEQFVRSEQYKLGGLYHIECTFYDDI